MCTRMFVHLEAIKGSEPTNKRTNEHWMFAFNTKILPLEEKLCVSLSLVNIRPQLRGVNRTPWNTRIYAYLAWDLE